MTRKGEYIERWDLLLSIRCRLQQSRDRPLTNKLISVCEGNQKETFSRRLKSERRDTWLIHWRMKFFFHQAKNFGPRNCVHMTVTIIEMTRNIILWQETQQKRFKLKTIWKSTKCFRLKAEFSANMIIHMQDDHTYARSGETYCVCAKVLRELSHQSHAEVSKNNLPKFQDPVLTVRMNFWRTGQHRGRKIDVSQDSKD